MTILHCTTRLRPVRRRCRTFGMVMILMAKISLALPVACWGSPPLIEVSISPEGRVKATAGEAKPSLVQGEWVEFELIVENTAGLTSPLVIESRQLMSHAADTHRDRWMRMELIPAGPLSGALEEKRTLRLWSRDAGRRAAVFNVNAGQGSQDLGFRSDVLMTFAVAKK